VALRIRNWEKHFENHKTRLLKNLAWIPIPTDLGSSGYAELVGGHPDGAAHFGFWVAMLEMAAKGAPRGHLSAGIRHHDARSMSLLCRMPVEMIETAIERLLTIGWIETWRPEDTVAPDQAPNPALERQIKDAEWKEGKEGKEGNEQKVGREGKGNGEGEPVENGRVAENPPGSPLEGATGLSVREVRAGMKDMGKAPHLRGKALEDRKKAAKQMLGTEP
jgi:hypothetical protein